MIIILRSFFPRRGFEAISGDGCEGRSALIFGGGACFV